MKSFLPQKCRNGSAGADAGGAGVKEIFHFLFAVDAAGGFDFHLFSHVFFKELHIGQHSAGAAKAGGCFDIIRSPSVTQRQAAIFSSSVR